MSRHARKAQATLLAEDLIVQFGSTANALRFANYEENADKYDYNIYHQAIKIIKRWLEDYKLEQKINN